MALLVLRSVGVVCRAKPNVPLVRWQKNKKMCVGQKLNLCLVSLSARFFCPFGLGSVVRYHCCQRFVPRRSADSLINGYFEVKLVFFKFILDSKQDLKAGAWGTVIHCCEHLAYHGFQLKQLKIIHNIQYFFQWYNISHYSQ